MRANVETWTVVVAGQWNRHIFTPPWVGKHLFEASELQIQTQVAPVAGGIRYLCEDVILIPQGDRLIVGARRADDTALQHVEEVARKTLELLPYTPVNACGMNFGFTNEDIPEALQPVFRFADQGKLSDAGAAVRRSDLIRALEFPAEKGEVANLKLSIDHESGALSVHVNFSRQSPNATTAREKLAGAVVARKTKCLEFLHATYGMALDEERETHDEPA